MKSILFALFMTMVTNTSASIEYDGKKEIPTEAELTKNRSCFLELAKLGCGEPGDDPRHFRSCLHDVFGSLTSDCKMMMTYLYKRKD